MPDPKCEKKPCANCLQICCSSNDPHNNAHAPKAQLSSGKKLVEELVLPVIKPESWDANCFFTAHEGAKQFEGMKGALLGTLLSNTNMLDLLHKGLQR